MNIYLHELKAYRKSTIIWTLSLIGIVVLFLSMYPSIAKDAEQFSKLLEDFPVEVRKAIGLSLDSFFSVIGFFSYGFLYVKLAGAIQAMNLGTSILSKETREKTADFLLSKPVSRTKIVTSKLLAAITSLFITNVFFLITTFVMVSIVKTKEYDGNALFMIAITLLFIQLMFVALGFITSVLFPRIKSVISVSLGTVFAFFAIGMVGSATGDEPLRYITPFNYYDTTYIAENLSYEIPFLVLTVSFFILAIVASYIIYKKKDVSAL
ncbi:ABC transporter permease [Bacillus sp. HMF5848]|uniref:ABC transporter permease subunit n=1 Tax=Bacillus sp. HMF5848 TaxID=2495421 RepID=UPI000F77D865|nr:ABC transporter permease subunit [Bacillus sp. HMF5848]RSK26047.1 ABC transporter permease [Bacillus sp. HMF5848]